MMVTKKIRNRVSNYWKVGVRLKLAKLIANSVGLPNLAGVFITQFRLWLNPIEYRKRKTLALRFQSELNPAVQILPRDGYCFFDENDFPDVSGIVRTCNNILDAKGRDKLDSWYETRAESSSKSFFYNLLDESDLFEYPQLMEFALSDEILPVVIRYFRILPRLSSIGLFYSKVSDEVSGSQNFHIDGTDPHHVKCFINISDVGPKNGPLTFIPADKTEYLRNLNGGLLKSAGLEDKDLLSQYERQHGISLTGKPGKSALVDASRCLHYGSRCEEGYRIVFMFHFAVFANYTNLEKNSLRDLRMQHYPSVRQKFGTDELRRHILKIDI